MNQNETTSTQKLAIAGVLTAAAVAGSLISVPVAGSKLFLQFLENLLTNNSIR